MYFFTSDLHIGHQNIIKYCQRPFKDIDDMNESLIRNWNKVVRNGDLVYHIGDFSFRERGLEYERRLNGNIVHILGNHDKNSKIKTLIKYAIMKFGKKFVFVTHNPAIDFEVPEFCDFIICGHVHEKWHYRWTEGEKDSIPIINVGVDVNMFTPIRLDKLIELYEKIKKEKRILEGDV